MIDRIPQDQREENLESFRDGDYTVLVATDVASRGLDIPDVKVRMMHGDCYAYDCVLHHTHFVFRLIGFRRMCSASPMFRGVTLNFFRAAFTSLVARKYGPNVSVLKFVGTHSIFLLSLCRPSFRKRA